VLVLLGSVGTRVMAQVPASEYGQVVLDKYSSKAGLGAVTFDHWLHRSKFTCRLCHVDIGFAMQANATGIRASTNREGFHCGACHNGKRVIDGQPVFGACSDSAPNSQCARCHSANKATHKYDYDTYTARFPKNAYGIDWEETEATGLIKPVDVLEGLSIKKQALKSQEDFSIQARVKWASDIIFSHKKHNQWNGCELCHPEIFPATQKGVTRYTMFHISSGQYCGVCHGKVAFTTQACGSCHKDTKNKEKVTDVVLLPAPARASGFGTVKFMHKTHVGEHEVKCETCHHPLEGNRPFQAGDEICTRCHTHEPRPPVKTALQGAFHNVGATRGLCIECHKQENAKKLNNDIEFVRSVLPQNQSTIDTAKAQLVYGRDPQIRELAQEMIRDRQAENTQMQEWLKGRGSTSWAPVKCRECHKNVSQAN
jgi:c(7)-type cytochrome triheme protein